MLSNCASEAEPYNRVKLEKSGAGTSKTLTVSLLRVTKTWETPRACPVVRIHFLRLCNERVFLDIESRRTHKKPTTNHQCKQSSVPSPRKENCRTPRQKFYSAGGAPTPPTRWNKIHGLGADIFFYSICTSGGLRAMLAVLPIQTPCYLQTK